ASLYVLQINAWKAYMNTSSDSAVQLSEWVEMRSKESAQFLYWYQAIVLQTLFLMLVHSVWEPNFDMYLDTLTQICPWVFALDHVHYARLLRVFVKTLRDLKIRLPKVHEEFMKGKFVIQKTGQPFSSLSDDHVHEQNNRNVKPDGGAVGLLGSLNALSKPEIARMVNEFGEEAGITINQHKSHHEDTKAFEKRFQQHMKDIVDVFEEEGNPFQEAVFQPIIVAQLWTASRVDVIFDKYVPDSLKAETREKHGTGNRVKVASATPIPKDWNAFLQVDENKEELFKILSEDLVNVQHQNKTVISIHHHQHLIQKACHHDEVDSQMLLHAKHAASEGHRKTLIRTVNSDVVIIAVVTFQRMNVAKLWTAFGVGKNKCHIQYQTLGPEVCLALPFWHAFTGCDTVSSFAGHGKKTAW
uniref:Uncharacterized protein n=1 Tax=Latimeria chalumnae TaxID=7897 RepID=H3B0T7_LATCH